MSAQLRPPATVRSSRLFSIGCVLLFMILASGCARKFSVSVNQQVLYDPRPGSGIVRVEDPGLQSCINVLVRSRELDSVDDIDVLACPDLDIASLDGINALSRLRFIDLAANELTDLDGLRGLTRLTSVNAPDNRLQDISALLSLATLTSAVLTGNPNIPCDQLDALQARLGTNLLRPDQCAI